MSDHDEPAKGPEHPGHGGHVAAPQRDDAVSRCLRGRFRAGSDAFEQHIEIDGGTDTDPVTMLVEESSAGLAPGVAQHGEEGPLGVELGRVAERLP